MWLAVFAADFELPFRVLHFVGVVYQKLLIIKNKHTAQALRNYLCKSSSLNSPDNWLLNL